MPAGTWRKGHMAKVKLNPMFDGLRGRMGDMVFRALYGGTVAGRVQDFSRRILSADQQVQIGRFKTAVPLAKELLADPQRRAECEALAAQLHKPLMAVAISIIMKSGH